MVRFLGPGAEFRQPFGGGSNYVGRAMLVYSDSAATTLADIRTYDPASPAVVGAAIAESKVVLGAQGRLPRFWFPDGLSTVWGVLVRGEKIPVQLDSILSGPAKAYRASSSDTRDLLALYDENGGLLYRVDSAGRPRSHGLAVAQTPTAAIGAAIGTSGNGAAVVLTNAADMAGTLAITTASTGTGAGILATITLTAAFGANAKAVFAPKDAASAALQVFNTSTSSAVSLRTAATPAASTTYTFDYVIVG